MRRAGEPRLRFEGKLPAAQRGGIKKVLIPAENEKDLAGIPDNVKKGRDIAPIASVDDLLKQVLAKKLAPIERTEDEEKNKPAKPKGAEEAVITR